MAHFAKINNEGIVEKVIVISNSEEENGQEFINNKLGLPGTWIQTSYNKTIRSHFAGEGSVYFEDTDEFSEPKPYPSWILNSDRKWVAPVEPENERQSWDENSQSWIS